MGRSRSDAPSPPSSAAAPKKKRQKKMRKRRAGMQPSLPRNPKPTSLKETSAGAPKKKRRRRNPNHEIESIVSAMELLIASARCPPELLPTMMEFIAKYEKFVLGKHNDSIAGDVRGKSKRSKHKLRKWTERSNPNPLRELPRESRKH